MIKSIFKSGWDKLKTLHKDDKGAVLMITLAVFLFLYMVCSATYAVGTVIHEKIQLQNACDAAAYSAAIVEADGLSRIATINRAMSWTYVQTTRMHMDYIVHCWLELTAKRFVEDSNRCEDFHSNFIQREINLGFIRWILRACGQEHRNNSPGSGKWFCGWTPEQHEKIRLGYSTSSEASSFSDFQFGGLVSLAKIQGYISKQAYSSDGRTFIADLQRGIQNGKLTIQMLNVMLATVVSTLNDEMYSAAESALKDNLPKDYNGDEYRVKILLPIFLDPYQDYSPENSSDNSESEYVRSVVSAYKNTEEDELEFLSASMKTDSLQNIFGNGIDQWFIRGTKSILDSDFNNSSGEPGSDDFKVRSLNHPAHITNWEISGLDHYAARGFQRGYKTANRHDIGNIIPVLRGNHVAYPNSIANLLRSWNNITWNGLIPIPGSHWFGNELDYQFSGAGSIDNYLNAPRVDQIPSCFNTKKIFAEQCNNIPDNLGLVAEYHWAAWKWWCGKRQHLTWHGWVTDHEFCYKHTPITVCPTPPDNEPYKDSHHGGAIYNADNPVSHSRRSYRSCFLGADDLSNIPAELIKKFFSPTGISGSIDPDGSTNNILGFTNMGYSRIYGDDAEIYDEDMYITEQVRPVKLNHRFFQDRIQVVVAKKQTNPFRWMLGAEAQQNISYAREVDKKSVFTMFDPPELGFFPKTWSVAISTATAAFRNADRQYTSREIYETKYRQTSSYEYDENINEEPYIKLMANGNELNSDSEFAKYRVGCPHVSENNIAARLRRTWNLCETDWNAVFLPTRYTHTGFHTSYDGYSDPNRRYGYESALAYRRYSIENNSGEGSSILNHIAQNLLSKMSYMKTNNDDSASTMELDVYRVEDGKLIKSGRESLRIGFGFIWAHPGTTDTCRIEDMTTYKIQ